MLIAFGVYPLLYALWLSLHKRNPVTRLSVFDPDWNWLKIFGDERVWGAIGHTYLYTSVAIVNRNGILSFLRTLQNLL